MTILHRFLYLLILSFIFTSSLKADLFDSVDSTTSQESEEPQSDGNKTDEDKEKKDEKKDDDNDKKDDDKDKKEEPPKEEPPKIGNFSLPNSQQPAALFGFGGNIIDKGEVQLYFFADYFRGNKRIVTDLIPGILFGITDNWSIFFNFPYTPIMQDGNYKSSGLEDFFVQLEYAFYNKSTYCYVDQATVVLNITAPTGSATKYPPTGFGAPSLFIGGTYYHVLVDWFMFTAQGAVLTSSSCGIKIGDQFLYQWGLGRNFPSPEGWIYAWMVEVDGQYYRKNCINGMPDLNTGGNVIYVTPSLWFSTKDMLLQFGVSVPVNQHLFGDQGRIDYAFNLNFAWSFY